MSATDAATDFPPADVSTRQRRTNSKPPARGGKPMMRGTGFAMGEIDFSGANLQYLICARDLGREYPRRAAVLLGVPDALGQRLAQLGAEELAAVARIKAPLLIPRQEPWWWERLFAAMQAGRADELQAVLEQAGLLVANGGPRGSDA